MRRLIILALFGALALGGTALAQEPDSIEARAEAARAEHGAALAAWEAEWVSYIEALRAEESEAPAPAPERPPAPVVQAPDPIEERLGFAIGYTDDGGCRIPAKTLSGSYAREADNHTAHAVVRTAPSGGDCERAATSFGLSIERRYEIGGGFQAVAKFGADRRSTAAGYALVGADGEVLARPDGAPSDPVVLPSGSADTIGGYLGISRALGGGVRATLAGNVVPVDWSAEEDSFAAHIAIAWDYGDTFDLAASADVGRDWYGAARASWRPITPGRIGIEISADFGWGLNSVDSGAPAEQTFAGLPVVLQGAPRDTATNVAVGITF